MHFFWGDVYLWWLLSKVESIESNYHTLEAQHRWCVLRTPQIETFAQSEYFATATPKISRVTTLLFVLWVTLTIFSFSFPQTNQSHQNYRIPRDNLTLYLCFEFPRCWFLLSVAWWKKRTLSTIQYWSCNLRNHRGQLQYYWWTSWSTTVSLVLLHNTLLLTPKHQHLLNLRIIISPSWKVKSRLHRSWIKTPELN